MATPHIIPGLIVHAAARVDAAGNIVAGTAVNVVSVVNTGGGGYTITMGTAIDPTQRYIGIQITQDAGQFAAQLALFGETDSVFDVITRLGGVATDAGFEFIVIRKEVPS